MAAVVAWRGVLALLLLAAACCAAAELDESAVIVSGAAVEPASHYNGGGSGGGGSSSGAFCSCASPTPVPLYNGTAPDSRRSAAAASDGGDVSAAGRGRHHRPHYRPSQCHSLRTAGTGEMCGASIAICKAGYCCGQTGVCSRSADACDGTCQCAFSGVGSACKGSFPFAAPLRLPTAARNGLCGPYTANCPQGQCCSQFSICVDSISPYCQSRSCVHGGSAFSQQCNNMHSGSSPGIVRATWVVTWKNLSLDGYTRPVIVVNGAPSPTLRANVGDRIIVRAVNRLSEPMSLHWHGMLQRSTNIMDGVTGVTQRPVMPGETYVYDFIADTAGSFWWHSHFKVQYMDGLRGAFIIDDPSATQYPADTFVTVADWYHQLASVLLQGYLSPASQGNEPVPYDALLNGLGTGYCEVTGASGCSYSYVKGVASHCSEPKTKMRFINMAGFAAFNISVDNHRMILVGEDGVQVEPLEIGSLYINAGQRYDVLVCQAAGAPLSLDPVWIRATMVDATFVEPSNYNASLGVLYYSASPPASLPTSQATFVPPALTPFARTGDGYVSPGEVMVVGRVKPPNATKTLKYTIEFYNEPKNDANATQYAHFNSIALQLNPQSPSYLERISNNPAGLPPPTNPPQGGLGWHIVDLKVGDVVDLVINNRDTGEHPIHSHGTWFWVVAAGLAGDGDYKGQPLVATLPRDTGTINAQSYAVLRYLATNPGSWFVHCHIDWHVADGLGMIFRQNLP